MAKGRQTKTLARISVTAAIVELPAGSGRKFLNWSVTRPLDPNAEKAVMHTTYNANGAASVGELNTWLAKNFPGVE